MFFLFFLLETNKLVFYGTEWICSKGGAAGKFDLKARHAFGWVEGFF